MKVIRAYCKKLICHKEPLSDKRTSHGICVKCYKREMKRIANSKFTEERVCIGKGG